MNSVEGDSLFSSRQPEMALENKRDGWLAALLLAVILFMPQTAAGSVLPPIRFSDAIILPLFITRYFKSRRLYGGFLFSYRVRPFALSMLIITILLLSSTILSLLGGRYSFYIKDFFTPIAFVRMVIIAAIVASFSFEDKQIRQFAWGIFCVSFLSASLAFLQKFRPYLISDIVEKLYAINWTQLQEAEGGVIHSRVVGTFGNPNHFSYSLVAVASMSLALSVYLKGFIKLLLIGGFISLGMAILVTTASRTGIVAFGLVTIFVMMLSIRGKAFISFMFILAVIVVGLLFMRANIDNFELNPRIKGLLRGEEGIQEGLYSRYQLWSTSFKEAKRSLIWGVGISKTAGESSKGQLTDNGYLIMLLRTGVLGLTTYLIMLLGSLRKGIKAFIMVQNLPQKGLALAFCGFLVTHMLFEITGDFFWFVKIGEFFAAGIGMLCAVSSQIADEYSRTYFDKSEV